MPGIIQQQQQPNSGTPMPDQGMPPQGAQPTQGPPQDAAQEPDISPQAVRGGMRLPTPQLQQAYERVVTAGMRVMFDPKTHGQMVQLLQQPGPVQDKIGKGIAGLMLLLWNQSNKSIPPQVIIPAGIELASHAVDFLKKAGQNVSVQEFGEGVAEFIQIITQKFGIDMGKLSQAAQGAAGGQEQLKPPGGGAPQPEPDADQAGGPSDGDGDEPQQQGA